MNSGSEIERVWKRARTWMRRRRRRPSSTRRARRRRRNTTSVCCAAAAAAAVKLSAGARQKLATFCLRPAQVHARVTTREKAPGALGKTRFCCKFGGQRTCARFAARAAARLRHLRSPAAWRVRIRSQLARARSLARSPRRRRRRRRPRKKEAGLCEASLCARRKKFSVGKSSFTPNVR